MTSKKVYTKKRMILKYSFGVLIILIGILLNYLNLGQDFFSYKSVGNYLIAVGFLILFISTIFYITKKKKIIDERMEKIGYQSSRITFSFVFLIAFIIMIYDGIKEITISYQIFMSYFICITLIIYIVTYRILERKK